MGAITVRLPNSVHQRVKELAERDAISVSQFIASAVAEKMASVMTLDWLRQEARQGHRSDFERWLAAVPDVAPAGSDAIDKAGKTFSTKADRVKAETSEPKAPRENP